MRSVSDSLWKHSLVVCHCCLSWFLTPWLSKYVLICPSAIFAIIPTMIIMAVCPCSSILKEDMYDFALSMGPLPLKVLPLCPVVMVHAWVPDPSLMEPSLMLISLFSFNVLVRLLPQSSGHLISPTNHWSPLNTFCSQYSFIILGLLHFVLLWEVVRQFKDAVMMSCPFHSVASVNIGLGIFASISEVNTVSFLYLWILVVWPSLCGYLYIASVSYFHLKRLFSVSTINSSSWLHSTLWYRSPSGDCKWCGVPVILSMKSLHLCQYALSSGPIFGQL